MTENQPARLAQMLREARSAVFFGGAGVSTESGIPDFRSADGLYNRRYTLPAETILSHEYFVEETEAFYDFYRDQMLMPGARPNAAHIALAQWEKEGKLGAVITQNIDGLHQQAGSRTVWELHGSVHRNHCMACGKAHGLDAVTESRGVPRCQCGGIIKPDVVLYGEGLDEIVIQGALDAIAHCDLLIIGGTSLTVYPAAGFVQGYRGRLVIINKSPTGMDRRADLLISAPIGQTLREAADILKG